MQVITSKDNDIIKNIKKLKETKFRKSEMKYIVEGIKMVKEAVLEKEIIEQIVICEDCIKNGDLDSKLLYEIAKYNCIYVTEKIYGMITETVNPQGILAVVKRDIENTKINYNEDLIVVLDGIQDPGNLGTILRTVDSVGLTQIIVSKNTVDAFSPKVVRSTMGAIFRVNVIETDDLVSTLKEIKKNKFKVMVTALDAEKNLYEAEIVKNAVVIGNEANGVSTEVKDLADNKIIIPMLGKTESLNAAVATSIVLYEYVRRKIK